MILQLFRFFLKVDAITSRSLYVLYFILKIMFPVNFTKELLLLFQHHGKMFLPIVQNFQTRKIECEVDRLSFLLPDQT